MAFQSQRYPLNVYLTDAPGLRFQLYILIGTLPLNLMLSFGLALRLGARPGPSLAPRRERDAVRRVPALHPTPDQSRRPGGVAAEF